MVSKYRIKALYYNKDIKSVKILSREKLELIKNGMLR